MATLFFLPSVQVFIPFSRLSKRGGYSVIMAVIYGAGFAGGGDFSSGYFGDFRTGYDSDDRIG